MQRKPNLQDLAKCALLASLLVVTFVVLAIKGVVPEGIAWLGQTTGTLVLAFVALWPRELALGQREKDPAATEQMSAKKNEPARDSPERKTGEHLCQVANCPLIIEIRRLNDRIEELHELHYLDMKRHMANQLREYMKAAQKITRSRNTLPE